MDMGMRIVIEMDRIIIRINNIVIKIILLIRWLEYHKEYNHILLLILIK